MKPGVKASFRITTSWQTPILLLDPVHKCNYFAQNSPSSLFYSLFILCSILWLPRVLVTNDMNQSLSKNQNVFALVSKSWGGGAGFQAPDRLKTLSSVSRNLSLPLLPLCSGRSWLCFSVSLSALFEAHAQLCTNQCLQRYTALIGPPESRTICSPQTPPKWLDQKWQEWYQGAGGQGKQVSLLQWPRDHCGLSVHPLESIDCWRVRTVPY